MFKRIIAALIAVLLVGLYVITLILALMKNEYTSKFLLASIAATIIIPVYIYAYQLILRLIKSSQEKKM